MPSFIRLLATNVRHKRMYYLQQCFRKKIANSTLWTPGRTRVPRVECKSAHALTSATATQVATTSFPTGKILVPPFQTASALDPRIILEYLSTSPQAVEEDVKADDMGRRSFHLALFFFTSDLPIFFLFLCCFQYFQLPRCLSFHFTCFPFFSTFNKRFVGCSRHNF